MPRVRVVRGDLTEVECDAIVNAANRRLKRGGGVDNAVHKAAGAGLQEELSRKYPGGCATGDAKITSGHRLRARWVVHAVGPVWSGGRAGEAELLSSAYRRAFELAASVGARVVAAPAISTGIYGYPTRLAAPIAVRAAFDAPPPIAEVVLVAFDEANEEALRSELGGA